MKSNEMGRNFALVVTNVKYPVVEKIDKCPPSGRSSNDKCHTVETDKVTNAT